MTTNNNTQSTKPFLWWTANRPLAAALMALGFELVEVKRTDDEVLFAFPVSRMLLDAVDAYWLDTLSVSAFRMGDAVERLEEIVSGHQIEGDFDYEDP